MIGMTELNITSTSKMLIQELTKSYKPNNIIREIQHTEFSFTLTFPTDINNDEKENVFETAVEKILHLKDPSDKKMETKVDVRYLQQASKEYFFTKGELVRYRGFIDTDNPIPMVTHLMVNLHSS